jgi:uncharacterized protein (TIGR02145 family)
MKNAIRFHICMALCIAMLASFSAFAQSSKDVKIGKQIWMSKNLDVSTFRNGDAIPEAKNKEEWKKAGENKQPAWCYYDYDENNGKKFGKLYNWFAVSDSRGLAPKDYLVPTEKEWLELVNHLGGDRVAGMKLKTIDVWKESNQNEQSDIKTVNSSRFSALPGGYCLNLGACSNIYEKSRWWTSTEESEDKAISFEIKYSRDYVDKDDDNKGRGYSVRCIKE